MPFSSWWGSLTRTPPKRSAQRVMARRLAGSASNWQTDGLGVVDGDVPGLGQVGCFLQQVQGADRRGTPMGSGGSSGSAAPGSFGS